MRRFWMIATLAVVSVGACDRVDRPKHIAAVLDESDRMRTAAWGEGFKPEERALEGERLRCVWDKLDEADVDPRLDFECMRKRAAAAADCYAKEGAKGEESADYKSCAQLYATDTCMLSPTLQDVVSAQCPTAPKAGGPATKATESPN